MWSAQLNLELDCPCLATRIHLFCSYLFCVCVFRCVSTSLCLCKGGFPCLPATQNVNQQIRKYLNICSKRQLQILQDFNQGGCQRRIYFGECGISHMATKNLFWESVDQVRLYDTTSRHTSASTFLQRPHFLCLCPSHCIRIRCCFCTSSDLDNHLSVYLAAVCAVAAPRQGHGRHGSKAKLTI